MPFSPPTSPAGVLPSQLDDQGDDLGVEGGSTRSSPGTGPVPSHQAAVPAQQRLGPDEEDRPAPAGEEPGGSRQKDTVCFGQLRTGHLAAQDGEFVAQDHDLEVFAAVGPEPQGRKGEDTSRQDVEDGQHDPETSVRLSGPEKIAAA